MNLEQLKRDLDERISKLNNSPASLLQNQLPNRRAIDRSSPTFPRSQFSTPIAANDSLDRSSGVL